MRLIVIGREGQLARALRERGAAQGVEIVALGRPELDLASPETIAAALAGVSGDALVNAAAYTAVDRAEAEEELATRINGAGAGALAAWAAARGLPFLHLSTDYVFGAASGPHRESDQPAPLGAYGRSKLAGERAVAAAHPGAVIFRTSWVYAPFGGNFVGAMLRLAETRDEIGVVDDQRGCPTSAIDLADALIAAARKRLEAPGDSALAGIFHMAGAGAASWADLAEEIFAASARLGGPIARVRRIATADYPTPARRPADSRLDQTKLADAYGLTLPPWRGSVANCVARLLEERKRS